MTDNELLVLAAKAVNGGAWHPLTHDAPNGVWNPLTDDGDAFRLAVKLRIKFRHNEALRMTLAWTGGLPEFEAQIDIKECGGDEAACARRAIVRVAAEIGKSLP